MGLWALQCMMNCCQQVNEWFVSWDHQRECSMLTKPGKCLQA